MNARAELAEKVALEYVELTGRLAAIVEWCVEHDGECLADNPKQLGYATEVLAAAREKYRQAGIE